jgi:hypothetical protein
MVTDPDDVGRAIVLGADLCLAAGTKLHARALSRSNKENQCPIPRTLSSPRPTTSGASA